MRIIYFYQYFTTPKGSWSTRAYEFSRRWVKEGHSVTVITSVYDKSDLKPNKLISKFNIEGVDVRVINVNLSNKHGIARRLWTFVFYAVIASWYALVLPADVVIASSPPISVGLPGLVARYLRRRPFVFEVRDLWPELPIQLGIVKNRLIIRFAKAFEKICYGAASRIIAVSEGMANWIRGAYGFSHITVVPNPSDRALFGSSNNNGNASNGKREKKLIVYAGTIGALNNCLQIVKMAEHLIAKNENNIEVLLIGDGKERVELERYARENALKNVRFLGSLPKDQVALWLNKACCALLVLRPVPVVDSGSPNKLCDAFAAGVPVIQTTSGWMREFLSREQCGINVPSNDPEAMAAAVVQLATDDGLREKLSKNARRVAAEYFDQDVLAQRMLDALVDGARLKA